MTEQHNRRPKVTVKRILTPSATEAKPTVPPSAARMGFLAPIANLIGKRVAAQRKTGALYIGTLEDLDNTNGYIRFSDCTIQGTRETHFVGDAYVFFQRGTAEFSHFHLADTEVAE